MRPRIRSGSRRSDRVRLPARRLGRPAARQPTPPARSQIRREPKPRPSLLEERDPRRPARRRRCRPTSRASGYMEQYEYAQGRRGLPRGPRARPGLDPRLDQPGDRPPERQRATQAEAAEEGRAAARRRSNFDEALDAARRASSTRDPDNLHAHFCRGIILEHQGELAEAHTRLQARHRASTPTTRHAWYRVGQHPDRPGRPDQPAGPEAGQGADRALLEGARAATRT